MRNRDSPVIDHNGDVDPLRLLAVAAGVVQSLRPTLVPRTTRHQTMVTAVCAATTGVTTTAIPDVPWRVGRWIVPVGLGLAVARGAVHVRQQRTSYPAWDPRPLNAVVAVAAGTAAGAALAGTPGLAARTARWAGSALAHRRGGSPTAWSGLLVLAAGTSLAGVAAVGVRAGLSGLRAVGAAADPALREAPDDPYVSGGPASAVAYDTLARDGRRFVSLRTPAEQIQAVCGPSAEPVRVYIGLYTAPTVEQRVDLALAELERLGGLERKTLLVMSPAGSGYAEYVAAESVECFTGGDCASVVVQYGVLPSVLSLRRVELGALTVRTLLDRLAERLREMPEPPRVLMYGESLGARVAQEALQISPSLVSAEGRVDGLDALVSVGTPGGRSLRNQMLRTPGVVHLDCWQQLSGDEQAQLWFLDHDADPVTRWDAALAWRRPAWLRGDRGRNVPEAMNWVPVLTWWQVIFDLVFAAQQQLGQFRSRGHDYRADLPPVLGQVLRAKGDVRRIVELLESREVRRDALLAEAVIPTLPE